MAVYEYSALDGSGKATQGIIDSDNPKSARAQLRRKGMFPTEVHPSQLAEELCCV